MIKNRENSNDQQHSEKGIKQWLVYVLIVAFVLLLGVFVISTKKTPSSYSVQEEKKIDWKWVEENCDCIEKNNTYCGFEGFEIGEDGLCHKDKDFTNPIRGCSKYNCTGEIYEVVK